MAIEVRVLNVQSMTHRIHSVKSEDPKSCRSSWGHFNSRHKQYLSHPTFSREFYRYRYPIR